MCVKEELREDSLGDRGGAEGQNSERHSFGLKKTDKK
jgi:hypothetical protein